MFVKTRLQSGFIITLFILESSALSPLMRISLWLKLAITGVMIAAGTLSLQAAPVDSKAKYVVSLAGVNVASVEIHFKDDGKQYQIDLGANISGVGTLIASGKAFADTNGKTSIGGLAPGEFGINTRANGQNMAVAVQFASGDATGFQVDPPILNNINRIALERKHLRGVADPIGSFILKGKELAANLCDRRLKVFTGLERFDIEMSYVDTQNATSTRTAYQGPVVLCRLRYVPISGHFTTSEMTAYLSNSDRILIWYAPLGTSEYFIPYRVLIGTSAGDLSMVLTGLN